MSELTDVCNDLAYQNTVLIKKRFALKNIPPQRLDNLAPANNPYYQNFTQSQLDMRRKVEVLKYSASKSNTKTNNLTKSQLWAQLVNGSQQQRSLSQSFIQENTISGLSNNTSTFIQTCPSGTIIETPTYASGIPGPIVNLYYDPAIPLYNYATSQNTYSLLNSALSTIPFIYDNSYSQIDNVLSVYNYESQNSAVLSSIYIQNITTPTYSFTIEFPISIFIKANIKAGKKPSDIKQKYSINITLNSPFNLNIQYGYERVQNVSYELVTSITKSIDFDVSMSDTSNYYYYANQYIGMCKIQNFTVNGYSGLTTEKGFIYDLCFNSVDNYGNPLYTVSSASSSSYKTYFENPTYGIYLNVSNNSINQYVNCTVRNQSNYPSYSNSTPFVIY
jgi:hypothetical protein